MLKLKIKKNTTKKLIKDLIKYFLLCFSNNNVRQIDNKKSIKGNLFPDKIMPVKVIKKEKNNQKRIFIVKGFKKRGMVKKANKENLCR